MGMGGISVIQVFNLLLICCVVATPIVAKFRGRSVALWAVLGLIGGPIALLILFYLGAGAGAGAGSSKVGEFEKLIEKDKKTGEYLIRAGTLGKAVKNNAFNYYKRFTPNYDVLRGIGDGASVGGPVGGLVTGQAIIGQAVSSYKAGRYSAGVNAGALILPESGVVQLRSLWSYVEAKKITQAEFVKAAASIAYNDGRPILQGKRDAFGELELKGDDDRLIAAMIVQFFHENVPPLKSVRSLMENIS